MKSFLLFVCVGEMLCAEIVCAQTLIERYRAAFTLKPEEGISFTADTTTRLGSAAVPAVNVTASGVFVLMGSGSSGSRTQATTSDGKTFTTRTTASGLVSFADGSTIYLPDGRMRYIGQETSSTHTKEKPRQHIASWISADGLTWTKESGVRFQPVAADDSVAGVPYCLQVKDSIWRLYYVGDLMGNAGKATGKAFNGVRTAISNDWGQTFTPEKTTNITREGDVDPHVVYLTNGKYRMYLKSAKSMGATTFIESTDGINFDTTKITEVIKSSVGGVGSRYDPFVVKFPDGRVLCFHGTDDGVQGGRQKIIADVGNAATGLTDKQHNSTKIDLYIAPNPASGNIRVNFTLDKSERVLLKLYTTLGQECAVLLDAEMGAGAQTLPFILPPSLFPQGAYFLRLTTPAHSQTYSLLVH